MTRGALTTGPCALLVTDRRLVPPWGGNRVRILGVIRALRALGWRVVLVASDAGPVEQLRPLVDGVIAVRARSFPGGELTKFDVDPFRGAVERATTELKPALVIAEYAWMAPAMSTLPRFVRRWVDCHDVLHERTMRFRAAHLDPWTICTREEEAAMLSHADLLIASQEREASVLRELTPGKHIETLLPAIVRCADTASALASSRIVLAVGAQHAGNEGIREFVRDAWPCVVQCVPSARLVIAGAIGAGLEGVPNVDVLGAVGDLDAQYARAAVVIVPVTVGTGVKIKMLEALRLGKAVVATEVAAEGMPEPAQRAWIAADTLPACADAVAALLADYEGRAALERAALDYGERHLSERVFNAQIRALLPNRAARHIARLLS